MLFVGNLAFLTTARESADARIEHVKEDVSAASVTATLDPNDARENLLDLLCWTAFAHGLPWPPNLGDSGTPAITLFILCFHGISILLLPHSFSISRIWAK